MFRRALVVAAGMGVMIALTLSTGSAIASPVTAEKPDPAVSKTISETSQEKTEDYWTSSRMKDAKSGDLLVRDRGEVTSDSTVATGEPTVVRGSAAKPAAKKARGFGGGYYSGGGKVVQTTGKVFFTLGGTNYVCSGSSTVAANSSLVQTAGHCLNEGPGAFATNFTFVPGYDDGAAPYGQFVAAELHTSTQWANQGDLNYDIGYAVVGTSGGSTLTGAVGAQGVGFNLARNANMYAFGYPAASPYDGTDIAWCHGSVAADTWGGSSTQGMVCNMTGGSSGGPWFINYNESSGIGTLNSLNSFKYTGGPLSNRM
ncbi:MAG: trypsin-like serine peptidase, partial [Aeromicrobium sp.]